jgi:hypothetical protein
MFLAYIYIQCRYYGHIVLDRDASSFAAAAAATDGLITASRPPPKRHIKACPPAGVNWVPCA